MFGRIRHRRSRKRLELTPNFHLNLTTQNITIKPIEPSNRAANASLNGSHPNLGKANRIQRQGKIMRMLIAISILGLIGGFSAFWITATLRADPSPKTTSSHQAD